MNLFVLFPFLLSVSYGFLLDDNSVTGLLAALRKEKEARATIATEVEQLRSAVTAVESKHQNSLCQCPPSKAVAFSATLTSDITSLGDTQPIIYDKVITNDGGAYDSRHGAFRAPVGGTYKFTFSVMQGTSSMYIEVELVRNGQTIGRVKTGDYGYYAIGTNIINVHLDAGDDVWVQHKGTAGGNHIIAKSGYYTMFTGHLVAED